MNDLPPLNALRVFDVTGRLESITNAADKLCVTPAAVSRQIRLLESHLGMQLFHRQHRRIVLTSAGLEYHADISKLFAGLHRATEALTAHAENKTFIIKAPHSVAIRWLLPRLAGFHRTYPDIDVEVITSVMPPDFESENIDAAICMGNGRWKNLLSYKLMVHELVPVCTPEKGKRLRNPADLEGEILLHTTSRPDYWRIWLRAAGVPHLESIRSMHYQASALTYEAALEGYGIAISQKAMVQKELDDGRLVMPFKLGVDLGDESYYFVLPSATYTRRSLAQHQFRSWIASCELRD